MKRALFSILIFTAACGALKPLTLERQGLKEDRPFRTNGYYYHCHSSQCTVFIVYNDGKIAFPGLQVFQGSYSNLYQLDQNTANFVGTSPWNWGVYNVSDHKLNIERWIPGTGSSYPTERISGHILNDTSIHISGLRGKKYEDLVDTFRFRHLHPKPDSTNVFIN